MNLTRGGEILDFPLEKTLPLKWSDVRYFGPPAFGPETLDFDLINFLVINLLYDIYRLKRSSFSTFCLQRVCGGTLKLMRVRWMQLPQKENFQFQSRVR